MCYGDTRTGNNNARHAANQKQFFIENQRIHYFTMVNIVLLDYLSTGMLRIKPFQQVYTIESILQAMRILRCYRELT